MKRGAEIDLEIVDVAYGGDGIARHEGRIVFVPFTITGEEKVPAVRHPEHGEHSRQILREVGYSEAEIEALRGAGTIGGP